MDKEITQQDTLDALSNVSIDNIIQLKKKKILVQKLKSDFEEFKNG